MDIKSGYWTFLTVLNALIADPKSMGGSSPLPGPQPGAFGARASFPSMRPSGAKAPWSTCCRWAGAPSCAGGTSWAPPTIPRPPGSPPRGRCGGSRGLGAALPRRARRHPDQRCGSLPEPWGGRRLRCFRRGRRGGHHDGRRGRRCGLRGRPRQGQLRRLARRPGGTSQQQGQERRPTRRGQDGLGRRTPVSLSNGDQGHPWRTPPAGAAGRLPLTIEAFLKIYKSL